MPRVSNRRIVTVVTLVVFGLLASASSALAIPITIPPGLAPGSTYHLVFVTSSKTTASSPNIADYDLFVSTQAAMAPELAALSTTWRAIGSTSSVDAIDHIDVNGPVYRLDGLLVASGEVDLFDGGLNTLTNPVGLNQFALAPTDGLGVWTGSTQFGLGFASRLLGDASPEVGKWSVPGFRWAEDTGNPAGTLNRVYGISDELVVPLTGAAVPEPATLTLVAVPTVAFLILRRRRRSRLAPVMLPDRSTR